MYVFTFKQELNHLLLQQFAMLGVHHAEFFLVDQHRLFMLPLGPGFFRDFVIDTFAQFARIQLKILAIGFTLQESTKIVLLILNPL